MNPIPSPFTNRGVITSPEDFFGRKIEINEILTRLRIMQSTAVVGERRIGKSSLLYHLYQTGVRRLDNDARFEGISKDYAGFFPGRLKKLQKAKRVLSLDNIKKFLGTVKDAKNVFWPSGKD